MKVIIVILLFTTSAPLFAKEADVFKKKADISYQKKEYIDAVTLYRQAANKKPENPDISYNLGIAEFKAENYDNSVAAFEKCINMTNDKMVKSKVFYNLAAVLLKKGKLQEAIDNFKKSLLLNPGDNESRQNLQIAINELKKSKDNNKQENNSQPPGEKDQPPKSMESPENQINKQILDALQKNEQLLRDSLSNRKSNNRSNILKDW